MTRTTSWRRTIPRGCFRPSSGRAARRSLLEDEDESSLRLTCLAELLGELEGPRVVDLLDRHPGVRRRRSPARRGRGPLRARVRSIQGGGPGRRARARSTAGGQPGARGAAVPAGRDPRARASASSSRSSSRTAIPTPSRRRSRRSSRSEIRRRCRCSSRLRATRAACELEDEGGTEGDASIGELVSEARALLARGARRDGPPVQPAPRRDAVRARSPGGRVRLGPAEAAIFETFVVPALSVALRRARARDDRRGRRRAGRAHALPHRISRPRARDPAAGRATSSASTRRRPPSSSRARRPRRCPGLVSRLPARRRAADAAAGGRLLARAHAAPAGERRGPRAAARRVGPPARAARAGAPRDAAARELPGDLRSPARVRAQARRHRRGRGGRAGGARVADRRDAGQRARGGRASTTSTCRCARRRCDSRAGATSSRTRSRASRSCPRSRVDAEPRRRGRPALAYVREAIDKYWGGRAFELTVNVGCATGAPPSLSVHTGAVVAARAAPRPRPQRRAGGGVLNRSVYP